MSVFMEMKWKGEFWESDVKVEVEFGEKYVVGPNGSFGEEYVVGPNGSFNRKSKEVGKDARDRSLSNTK